MSKRLYAEDGHLVWDAPYNEEELASLKAAFPGARWDAARSVWLIPGGMKARAQSFALRWNASVDASVRALNAETATSGSVEISVGKILAKFDFNQSAVDGIKAIPGASWRSRISSWLVPMCHAPQAVEWADRHGISVEPKLRSEAEALATLHFRNLITSVAEEGDLEVDGLMMDPHGYQRAGMAYITANRRCFVADEMGLGKTLQAVGAVHHNAASPSLVVVPASLTVDWQYKIRDILGDQATTQVIKGRAKDQALEDADFTIIGYPNISHHADLLKSRAWGSVVFDESHYLKNGKAQRTKAAKAITKKMADDSMILLLTGTPVKNAPADYVAQLDVMRRLDVFGGAWRFYHRYCDAKQTAFGWDFNGSSNLEELQTELRKHCYVRREKKDVLQALPPKTYSTIATPLGGKFAKAYKQAKEEFENWYHGGHSGAMVLAQLTTLRRLAGEGKVEHALEWLQNATEQGEKTVTVAHHRDIVNTIADATGGLRIIGGQTTADIERDKERFQSDPDCMNITVSVTAAGHGHTLTAATNMIVIEPPWTPAEYRQVTDRIHRIGQESPVTIYNMSAPDTIDEIMYATLLRKLDSADRSTSRHYAHDLAEALLVAETA